MATTRSQRIGIWIIALAMIIGTVAGFVAMILAPQNEQTDAKAQQEQMAKMMEEFKKQQLEDRKKNKPLDGYTAEAFDPASVKELQKEVLVEGEGVEAGTDSTLNVNYFGWDNTGSIFDSTNREGKVEPRDLKLAQVIKGWKEGLTGLKAGTVVRLTIPADKAYGTKDDGTGKPIGPLKFVVDIKEVK